MVGIDLAEEARVPPKPRIRNRLLTITLLGVVMSALCLAALVRVLSLTTASRTERAREAVTEAVQRVAAAGPTGAGEVDLRTSLIGVRGGVVTEGGSVGEPVPSGWRAPIAEAIASSSTQHARVVTETHVGEADLIVSAEPTGGTSVAWAAYPIVPSQFLFFWRVIVFVLTFATGILVATAIYFIFTVNRSAAALNASLVALATDLSAPVARPPVGEFADMADGIAQLAKRLSAARDAHEALGKELAQKERLAALGRVAAGVAHEVRNPLASIKLRLDLAAAGADLPEAVAKSIASASSEIDRLDRLVADLLIVAGRNIGPRKKASLGDLAKRRVEALAPWAAEQRVDIDVQGDVMVPVDADSLSRAIDNLVRNAVEASAPGTKVDVLVSERDGTAWLRVEDHGAGVPGDRAAELFEPFFTTKPAGMGLGLALSRSIARSHGGDLIYARVGDATRFELTVGERSLRNGKATEPMEKQ